MAQCQVEGGGTADFEQILPTDELLAIYRRITENEIKAGCRQAWRGRGGVAGRLLSHCALPVLGMESLPHP